MRKLTKKFMAFTLVLAMAVTLLGNVDSAYAKKAKPTMSKKTSVTVKKTKTIKIKNLAKSKIKKTTWKVSSKKKLKITKKSKNYVKVKALRTGKAKVKATVRTASKIYRFTTTVTIKKAVKAKTSPSPSTQASNSPSASPVASPSASPAINTSPSPVVSVSPSVEPSKAPAITQTTAESLVAMAALPDPSTYVEKMQTPPDLLKMNDGTAVTTKEQWQARRLEIRTILQRYMYGVWRDGEGETVTYTKTDSKMTIKVALGNKQGSFDADVTVPTGTAPEGGWPVIVSVGGMSNSYAGTSGYAIISFDPNSVGSDNANHTGLFYTLYPYSASDWKTQTGSVMSWAWGTAKILDALEAGAGVDFNISTENTIVTGVSRYGKAAACAGAFEERFKVSMPVCSGYGGMTMARYLSNNITYNLLPEFEGDPKTDDVADLSAWKSTGGNEPIQSLQGAGWFCDAYSSFANYQMLPFDANYIASLSAMDDRYLFIVTGINSDMWSSPPGFWWTYQLAKPAFDMAGVSDNMAIQMHLNLHGIETEDLCKLFTYTDYHFYGKTKEASSFPTPWNERLANWKLADLKTCIFASEANADAYQEGMPKDASEIPENPDNVVPINISFGDDVESTAVSRSAVSDGLVTELTGDEAQTGFTYRYGMNEQYGKSYAQFMINLPEGKNLSDYSTITFDCITDSNYYGKRMAFVVNSAAVGMPEEIDYDYNTGNMSKAVNITGGNSFPSNTSSKQSLSLTIDKTIAAQFDGVQTVGSVYIHMENVEGAATYTITNIKFVE